MGKIAKKRLCQGGGAGGRYAGLSRQILARSLEKYPLTRYRLFGIPTPMSRYRPTPKWNAELQEYSNPFGRDRDSKRLAGNGHYIKNRWVINPISPVVFGQLDLFEDFPVRVAASVNSHAGNLCPEATAGTPRVPLRVG